MFAAIVVLVARSGNEIVMPSSVAESRPGPSAAIAPAPLVVAPATTAEAATVAPAPRPTPLIDVEIHVTPETATVSIDGQDVRGNPFAGQYVTDSAVHHIRVAAPGYVTKSVPVPFSGNVTLDLSLERVPPTAPPPRTTSSHPGPRVVPAPRTPPAPPRTEPPRSAESPRAAEPAPAPAPARPPATEPASGETRPATTPTDIDPRGGNAPRRQIDPNNPYGD
jgi:hypothetical protein